MSSKEGLLIVGERQRGRESKGGCVCDRYFECEVLNWQSRKEFFRSINIIRPFKQQFRNNSYQNHRNLSISVFSMTVREHPGVVDVTDWLQVDGQLFHFR